MKSPKSAAISPAFSSTPLAGPGVRRGAWKEDMHVAFWQQATEILAGLTAMGIVVSGNDAGRKLEWI